MAKKRGPCRKLFQAPLWGCHFFILSPALLWGDFLFLSLSLSVSPFLFLLFIFFFYFMMFSFFFFVVAVVSSGAVALFYHAKFAEPGLRRSHQPRLHLGSVFSLRFDYPLSLLLPHSHPFPLTSSPPPKTNFTHQVCLSSPPQPPSFLHLSPFDQEPACSFLLLPFAHFCVYSAIFPPFSRSKTLFAPDRYDAPGLLNRWRGYFCSSPWGHQTLCLSACLRWHPLQASSIWKCSSRVKAMFVSTLPFSEAFS